jgi:hypothetical protein
MLPSIDATNNRAVDTWWADQLEVVSGRARTNIASGTARIGNHKIVKVQSMQQKSKKKLLLISQYKINVGLEKEKSLKLWNS